jgi:hypothetical protein
VKVKFEIEKGKGFNISKNYLILKAVMLLVKIAPTIKELLQMN